MLQSLFSTWPSTLLLVAGAIFLLLALTQGMACRRHWRRQRRVAAMWRGLWLLLFLGLAVLGGGGALALRGWQGLGSETPVLRLTASQQGPGQWVLQLDFPDGAMRAVELKGDAWRVEAIVVKWQLPALLAGVPP
ncbi:MAG TPA: hypothetical protein VFN09_09955, partial [Rhodanobacteraceae bacterium]|nr:hypothetical protein [Rhodanobacteraceae bacterium]